MNSIFVGRYRLLEEVGRGGMGVVYKAEDPSLERLVAVKILPPKLLRNKEVLRRFLREAKVSAKLEHPNIVPIYDIGEDNGIYYMIMEYLEGDSLRDWLEKRQEIDIEKALNLFKQTARALDYAHRHKVIHRDVKPENIMVLANGVAKVTDFGIAVMDDRHSVTQMGAVLGTIAYLSPEQAQGKQADARSDIYSLGIVLFECLTGLLPFQARTPSEMLTHHLFTPPPLPSSVNPSVSKKLDEITINTLAKNPDERYQSVSALLEDLKPLLKSQKASDVFQGALASEEMAQPTPRNEEKTQVLEDFKNLRPENIIQDESSSQEEIVQGIPQDFLTKYRPIVDRLQKDLDAIKEKIPAAEEDQVQIEKEKIQVPCSKCGALNDSLQKYCLECGALLASSSFSSHPESLERGIALYEAGQREDALKLFQEILKKDSKLAEAHCYAGLCCLQTNRFQEALSSFRRSAELEPDNANAWEGFGDAAFRLSQDLEALRAYQSAIKLAPSAALWGKLAQVQKNLGLLEEACKSLTKAVELDPTSFTHSYELIQILTELSRFDEALENVQSILTQKPQDVGALQLLGEIYEKTDRYDEALQTYQEAVSIKPDDAQSQYRLGNLLEQDDQSDSAIEHLTKSVEIEPTNPDVHVRLAELYLKENQDDAAFTHFEKASRLSPNDPEIHKQLAELFLKKHNMDQATVHLEWTVALDPTDPDAHSRLGQIYYKKNQTQQSIREYKTAIQFDPYNPEFHENLGMVYYVEEELEQALEEMKKAVSLNPENVDYRKALGVMYETKGLPNLARKEYQKAVEIAPYDSLAQGLLGRVYFEQNLMNLAIYQYQKSLELEPKSYLMLNLLGKAYLKLEKYGEAAETYQKALSYAPKANTARNRQILGKNYFYLGKSLFENKDMENSTVALQQAAYLLPMSAKVFHLLGKIKLAQRDKRQGQQFLLHASRLAVAGEEEILFDLAELLNQLGDSKGAIRVLSKSVESAPQKAAYHGRLGDFFFASAEYDKSWDAYQQALKWEKTKKDVYHWKCANVLIAQKNYGDASEQLKRACSLVPENWKYHQDLAKVYETLGMTDQAVDELEKAKGKAMDSDALSLIQEALKRLKP